MKLRRHLSENTTNYEIQDEDALHSVLIKEMSNYDEYPRMNGQAPPLREIDAQPVRQHVFGNPFKVNKVQFLSISTRTKLALFFLQPIDEIDELVGSTAVPQQMPRKRSQLEQALSPGLSAMKKKRTRLYSLLIDAFILFFSSALVLKNYVYRRHSFNGGPPSPATSTSSTDDGREKH